MSDSTLATGTAPAAASTVSTASTASANSTTFAVILSLSFCHLLNDMMQSLVPALYPILKDNYALSFGQVGLITLDEGRIVDEYLSVPEFWGPLPPGDVIALGINPTVVSRLTGADAASLRAVARTADSPADLPPAPELFAELASVLRIASAP